MHELGIATEALEQALARAQASGATRITGLGLRVGALSGVDPESLEFALEALLPGTLAAGAAVEIEPIAAKAHCPACGRDFAVATDFLLLCPDCGRPGTDFTGGRELHLSRIEVI